MTGSEVEVKESWRAKGTQALKTCSLGSILAMSIKMKNAHTVFTFLYALCMVCVCVYMDVCLWCVCVLSVSVCVCQCVYGVWVCVWCAHVCVVPVWCVCVCISVC